MITATEMLLDEIENGKGLPLKALAKFVPPTRKGRPVTFSCVLRWVLDGAKAPGGERVRLEAARLGGKWLSTRAALRRFILRQTPGAEVPKQRTPVQRSRASERAARELERAGI